MLVQRLSHRCPLIVGQVLAELSRVLRQILKLQRFLRLQVVTMISLQTTTSSSLLRFFKFSSFSLLRPSQKDNFLQDLHFLEDFSVGGSSKQKNYNNYYHFMLIFRWFGKCFFWRLGAGGLWISLVNNFKNVPIDNENLGNYRPLSQRSEVLLLVNSGSKSPFPLVNNLCASCVVRLSGSLWFWDFLSHFLFCLLYSNCMVWTFYSIIGQFLFWKTIDFRLSFLLLCAVDKYFIIKNHVFLQIDKIYNYTLHVIFAIYECFWECKFYERCFQQITKST